MLTVFTAIAEFEKECSLESSS